MAVPSAVTQRKEGNTFVAESGMLVSGVTGFGIRTGFYLTNSGNYPIRTELADGANYPMIFDFPSGNSFTINPGQNKIIRSRQYGGYSFISIVNRTRPRWKV